MKTGESAFSRTLGAAIVLAGILARPGGVEAAVTVDQIVSANGTGTITTGAFSTSTPGELVAVFVASDGPAAGSQTLSVSGAGLAWNLVRRANAQAGTSEIWMAIAPAVLSNVTATSTQGVGGYDQSLTVVAFKGATGVGASASASGPNGAASALLTTTQAASLVFGVGNDSDRAVARTIGANLTLVHQNVDTRVNRTFWVERVTDSVPTAGTLVPISDTVPIADRWNLAEVEIVSAPPATTQTGPVVDALVSSDGNGRLVTQAFSSSSPGELIVALVASDGPASGGQTLTVSGAGLTWSLARRANARLGTSEVWTATASGVLSNVTVTSTQRFAGFRQSLTVVAFDGANGVGASANASGAGGAPGVPVTTTRAGSLVVGVGNDWDHAIARIAAAGQVLLHQDVDTNVNDTFWAQATGNAVAGAGTLVLLADTAPATDQWNLAAVEILSSAQPVTVTTGPAVAPSIFFDGSGTISTSPFATATPGALLLAFVGSDGPAAQPQSVTVTGAGLTWSLVRRANTRAGTAEIWTATATAPLAGATVTSTPAIAGYHQSLTVVPFDGARGVGASAVANAASGRPTVSLNATQAGSFVFGVGNDWDNAIARTVDAGQAIVHQWVETASGDTFWVQARTMPSPSAGAAIQLRDTAPTTDRWNFAAVEILAPTAASTPTITVTLGPPANANGWNNTPVTAHFTCADPVSGIATCPPDRVIATAGANQTVSGTTTNGAGVSASVTSVSFNIDLTPPTVTVNVSALAGGGGFYTSPVLAHFTCADGGSGVASCPPDQLVTTEGSGRSVSGTVTDVAGNTASVTSAQFSIDLSPPVLSVSLTPSPNADGWNNGPVTAHFICADSGSGVATCPADQTIAAEGANQPITGSAIDVAGNTSTASATVNIDRTPPALSLTSPAGGVTLFTPAAAVAATSSDALSGLADATCNGLPATLVGGTIHCNVTLTAGANVVNVAARDVAGNTSTSSLAVTYTRVPVVTVTSPQNSSYLNITPATVTGTVDDDTAVVTINSIVAPVLNRGFSIALPLAEGPNIVTASATVAGGAVGTASIEITLDTTPPHVTITSPADQFVTTADSISVAGNVNDLVVGTVNDQQAQVAVNGSAAAVANRTFLAGTVPLALGVNDIRAVATDRVGNAATTQITVIRQPPTPAQPQIHLVSGNNQSAAIGAGLAAPLVVSVTDGAGNPVAGKPIVFKVKQNDGLLAAGGVPAPTVVAATGADGRAQALWTLGNRAGAGSNLVEAYSVDVEGTAIFTATGTQGAAGKVVVDAGNDQVGAISQPLPKPFIAVVVDAGNNRLAGVPVTFTVKQGGGSFEGQGGSSFEKQTIVTVETDSDGRAAATLTLGLQEGNANNLVLATFDGNIGFAAAFTASGRVPGNPSQTTISGVVMDNGNTPIPGVLVRAVLTNELHSSAAVVQAAVVAQTDQQGQFSISGAPVGLVKVLVDGSTAQLPGIFPSLEYDIVTVAGQINTISQPIYLLPLNTDNQLCVTAASGGGTLTIPEAPGFSLTFSPGQVTFPGGSRTGCVSVTVVHMDKVPMMPGFGQQPRFIVTIQPSGAVFNPPAPITLPNVDGLKPRAVTEMYSFDHDIGSFVAIGTGIVSDDGQIIRSSAGVGVLKAGWHCGGDPNTSGNVAECGDCRSCNGTECITDDSVKPKEFCKECKNGTVVEQDVSSWKDDVTVGASAKLPDALKSALENGINRIPGVHVNIEEVKLGVSGKVKDCCDPGNGQTVTNGKKEGSVTIEASIRNLNVQIWPLPPTMIDKTWSVSAFGQIGEVRILFLAGVFIRSNIKFGAEGGVRLDACGSENCGFGGVTAAVSIGLVGEVSAQGCFDSTFTSPVCTPTIDVSIAPLTLGIAGKAGYNVAKCDEGLSGYIKVLGLKASFEFKLPLLPTLSAEYEIFGGFCALGNCP